MGKWRLRELCESTHDITISVRIDLSCTHLAWMQWVQKIFENQFKALRKQWFAPIYHILIARKTLCTHGLRILNGSQPLASYWISRSLYWRLITIWSCLGPIQAGVLLIGWFDSNNSKQPFTYRYFLVWVTMLLFKTCSFLSETYYYERLSSDFADIFLFELSRQHLGHHLNFVFLAERTFTVTIY